MADRSANHWQAARAVFWSFFGVRKRADYEHDATNLSLIQVVAAGLIGTVLFIITVLGIVMLVTG